MIIGISFMLNAMNVLVLPELSQRIAFLCHWSDRYNDKKYKLQLFVSVFLRTLTIIIVPLVISFAMSHGYMLFFVCLFSSFVFSDSFRFVVFLCVFVFTLQRGGDTDIWVK